MKKTLLVLALALGLTACGNNSTPAQDTAAKQNTSATTTKSSDAAVPQASEKKTEHYIVGTEATLAPFTFKDERGQVTGFEIELLKAIAENQGFSVDVISKDFDGLIPDLQKDKYQILAATLSINPDRLTKVDMSDSFVVAPNALTGKTNSNATAKTLAEIGTGVVGVQKDSHSHEELTKAGVKNIKTYNTLYTAYADLMRGNIDYVLGDAATLNHFHMSSNAKDTPIYTSVYSKTDDANTGFAVQKGNTVLLNKINAGLKAIRENGKYDEIYKKWFGDNESFRVSK